MSGTSSIEHFADDELRERIERRVAAALERGAHVVGYIPCTASPRDVILSDDPPGATYGTCPDA